MRLLTVILTFFCAVTLSSCGSVPKATWEIIKQRTPEGITQFGTICVEEIIDCVILDEVAEKLGYSEEELDDFLGGQGDMTDLCQSVADTFGGKLTDFIEEETGEEVTKSDLDEWCQDEANAELVKDFLNGNSCEALEDPCPKL